VSPDLRVLLDLPVAVALARRHADVESVNRFDTEQTNFHQAVRDAYLSLAEERPDEWLVVDASLPPREVAETTYRSVSRWIVDHLARQSDVTA
jgi:dTMP kinase